ncbi:outer membrane beta-barrel protein [Marinifilum fragile]|uniref:outer membrane beta-barrel protein n=1 Tax=Marinifilum fragile TaxID=570161 RepID=UPI002AA64E71|nr:outer membrane beta-barrel protein [Marinifilum fragile]
MRLIFTTICLLFFTNMLLAQTEKGKFLIGAQSSLSFSSMDNELKSNGGDQDMGSTKEFEFAPQVGCFVIDGLAIGAELPFTSSKQEDEDGDEYKMNTIAFVPFARYYFGETNVKPYVHAGFGFGSAKEKNDYSEQDYSMTALELGGGMAIFLNESIAVDLGLGYASTTLKPDGDYSGNPKIVTSGLAFQVGFTFSL